MFDSALPTHVGPYPLIRALIDRLGLFQILQQRLPPHTLSRVSDADCLVVLIANILSGRVALYEMNDWLDTFDAELLLGEGCPLDAFDDARLAACLDHLDACGTDTLLSAVVQHLLTQQPTPARICHLDTTSLTLYGDYDLVSPSEDIPLPTYGFSKDHRPDLKQLIFGMALDQDSGLPLAAQMLAGNTHDAKAARVLFQQLTQVLPDPQEMTVVGDCKLVDGTTLGQLLGEGLQFISLLPKTFSVHAELLQAARTTAPETWPVLAQERGKRKGDPDTIYRGQRFERVLNLQVGPENTTIQEPLGFLVVYSPWKAEQQSRRIEHEQKQEEETFRTWEKKWSRKVFHCEADARAEVQLPKLTLHRVHLEIVPEERACQRHTSGRPRKGEATPKETVWVVKGRLEVDDVALAIEGYDSSCFILVFSHIHQPEVWPDTRILEEYRHQSRVEGHTGFRWLKGPAAIAPVFLHKPERIRALGLVFLFALMVRNYLQFTLIREAKAQKETLEHPFSKQKVERLTTEMALAHFAGLHGLIIERNQQRERPPARLKAQAKVILRCLKIPETVFWIPPAWKSPRGVL